jgi:hypothetical protein
VERPDIGSAVAEKADRDVLVAFVLRAPGGAARDRQMRADDGVGPHHTMLLRGEMHGAAFAAHQPVVALHEFAEHLFDRDAARQGMSMTTISAETEVAFDHGLGKPGGNRLLPERQMAGALDQILQEQVVGALFGFAQAHLRAVERQPLDLADIVIEAGARLGLRPVFCSRHGYSSKSAFV